MLSSKAPRSAAIRSLAAGAVLTLATLSLSACGGSSTATSTDGSEKIGVSLIVKTTSNPFFVSMQDGATKVISHKLPRGPQEQQLSEATPDADGADDRAA